MNLLSLLRASLNGEAGDFAPDTDWNAVFRAAGSQNVRALAAMGLPDTLTPAQYAPWKSASYTHLSHYTRYLSEQDMLCSLFAGNDIPMVILKGFAAAANYPDPPMRAMGDIDVLIAPGQFEISCAVMQEAGYTLLTDNGRHVCFQKNDVSFELHRFFSFEDLDVEDCIAEGMSHREYVSIDGCSFPVLPKLAEGIVLISHIWKHLHAGIGLRHIIDWMMFVKAKLDNDFWQSEFSSVMKALKMETLAITMTRLCQIYLGLSEQITWCGAADDLLCSRLMSYILASGDLLWEGRAPIPVNAVNRMRKEGVFPYLQRAGEKRWELCHRYHWLRPAAWMYEIFSLCLLALKLGRRPMLSMIRKGREKIDLLDQLGLL